MATLSVTEVNFSPYSRLSQFGDSSGRSRDYGFIELTNVGDTAVNLSGIRLAKADIGGSTEGVDFVFGDVDIASGEQIVVVENIEAFESRYGLNQFVAGVWSGNLSKTRETITLLGTSGEILQQFAYDSTGDWPRRAAEAGATLELKDGAVDLSSPQSWRSSRFLGGSPGIHSITVARPDIVINEILAHTDLPQVDSIELFNAGETPVDVGGWFISDDVVEPTKFRIPLGTVISPKGFLVFDEYDFNPGGGTLPSDFALSELGEEVWIFTAESGRPFLFVDDVAFDANLNGVSLGRLPNGNRDSDMLPLDRVTLGRVNLAHKQSDIVITEIQYHPANDDVNLEYIELFNSTDRVVEVGDWRIDDAVDAVIPLDVSMTPNERIVLVAFDPGDTSLATNFRNAYDVDPATRLYGPWGAKRLSNNGESTTLKAPTIDGTGIYYYVVEQVRYSTNDPWPQPANESGQSLSRIESSVFGNDSSN